jgi:hypothetical protein
MPDTHSDPDPRDEARRDGEHDDNGAKDHGDSAPAPFAPHEDDDSALGDTDQHSDA